MTLLKGQVGELERHSEVATMAAWLPHAEVSEQLLVSVVMPTRDRRELLADGDRVGRRPSPTPRWELLVVDDGSTDDTAEFLGGIEDPRVRTLKAEGVGACGGAQRWARRGARRRDRLPG